MKKSIILISLAIFAISCASKKGAYQQVPVPKTIVKEIVRHDTVYIVKRDTVFVEKVVEKIVEKKTPVSPAQKVQKALEEKPAPASEPIKIVVKEEKISLAEGEMNTEIMERGYHIVVGSFKSKSNAAKRQREFNNDYDPTLVVNEQGMFRVILLSFDEYDAAKDALREISSQVPKDSWILVQKR